MGRILEGWRKVDGVLRAGGWAWVIFCWLTGLTGAAVVAWASTTWAWYWTTFSWAGVAAAFVFALLIFAVSFLLTGLAVQALRRPENQKGPNDNLGQGGVKIGSPTLTQHPPTLTASLYVGEIRFNFADLAKDRHSEITMRVFNGSGRVVQLSQISGCIKFHETNNDPKYSGKLPEPTIGNDTARTVAQLNEWFLIFAQKVPAEQADKLLAMIAADVRILFDLREFKIEVFATDTPQKIETFPMWGGVSYDRTYGFMRVIMGTANQQL
jgi:hypothetical protein